MRFNSILWGGRFNPIIPVDDEQMASQLVELFHVDALYPIDDLDPVIRNFTEKYNHLKWPILYRPIVVNPKTTPQYPPFVTVLDIYHALVSLHKEYVKDLPQPNVAACLYLWEEADPLSNILLATCGAYPPFVEIGIDYAGMMKRALACERGDNMP